MYINNMARTLYERFLPGPVTVVSKGKGKLARGIESRWGTQGVRISSHPFVQAFLAKYPHPITATSANASYKKVPYTITDVLKNTSRRQQALVDLMIDAGTLPHRAPSTVIDTTLDTIHVVRQGALQLHHPQKVHAYSLHETEAWVGELYAQLKDSWGTQLVLVLLQGDLGAGKTQFTKYLAYLGITQVVTSPTFTLCNEYQGSVERHTISLYHIDTYRMYDPEELEDLTPQEIFKPPHVVVIEWAIRYTSAFALSY